MPKQEITHAHSGMSDMLTACGLDARDSSRVQWPRILGQTPTCKECRIRTRADTVDELRDRIRALENVAGERSELGQIVMWLRWSAKDAMNRSQAPYMAPLDKHELHVASRTFRKAAGLIEQGEHLKENYDRE